MGPRSGHLSIEGAASDTWDRVAVTYPGQMNCFWSSQVTATRSRASLTSDLSRGDRYAVTRRSDKSLLLIDENSRRSGWIPGVFA